VAAKREHRRILGESIRSFRRRAGLSQEKLAEKADLHPNYVGEIERGEKAATIDTLVKLANALRMSARDLLEDL
jgi:XRE family transcriptional regulator, regulator of sulfur utilization